MKKVLNLVTVVIARIWKDLVNFRIPILLLVLYGIATLYFFSSVCPFVILTGFPCAGCGLTRAVLSLCTGDFASAMRINLSVVIWVPFLLYIFIRRYIQGKELTHLSAVLVIVCLMTLGYYCYRMAFLFPSEKPMVYTTDNLFVKYITTIFPK